MKRASKLTTDASPESVTRGHKLTVADSLTRATSVTANSAGTWRWYFPGTTTTAQVASGGDAVKLK